MSEKGGLFSRLFSRFKGKKSPSENQVSHKEEDELSEEELFEEEKISTPGESRPSPRSRPTIFRKVKRSSATKYIVDDIDRKVDLEEYDTGYYLEVLEGLEKGRVFNLNRKLLSIGKLTVEERDGWILLDTSTISSDQSTLKWIDKYKKFAIIHNRSAKTHTYVNNVEVSDEVFTLLRDGDFIRVGNVEMIVVQKRDDEIYPYEGHEEDYSKRQTIRPGKSKEFSEAFPSLREDNAERQYEDRDAERKAVYRALEEFDRGRMDEEEPHEREGRRPHGDESQKRSGKYEKTMDMSFENSHMFQIVAGPDKDKVITISKDMIEHKLTIGRKGKERKDIELSDPAVFDLHARLTLADKWLFIALEDEKASIFVNEQSVKMKGLEDGDVIRIGNTVLEHFIVGPQSTGRGASLEVMEGYNKGKVYSLKKNLLNIGRKSDDRRIREVELPEADRSVSRHHAIIEKKNNKFYLINQKSKNLTFLNGVHVTEPRPLVNGDKIKIGNQTVFLFRHIEAPVILRDKQDTQEQEIQREMKVGKVLGQREIKVIMPRETRPLEKEPSIPVEVKKEIPPEEPEKASPEEEYMVFIPGGAFLMGIDEIECDANPLHEVFVEAFYIDKYPVTNIQYERFVVVMEYTSEGNWEDYFTDGKDNFPVVGVTYNDAKSYAAWAGKRLPTEAEWEKAARGTSGQFYPWGNEWSSSKLCSKDGGPLKSVYDYSEGVSPYGVHNMLGTVWEWTGDHYSLYPYKPKPVQSLDTEVVIRGGEWLTELQELGVTIRAGIYMDEYVESVGFRCARDAGKIK